MSVEHQEVVEPVAVVVDNAGANTDGEAVIAHCASAFAKWQLPDDVLVWDDIPLTSTGKIDKKTIRAKLAADGYQLPDLR